MVYVGDRKIANLGDGGRVSIKLNPGVHILRLEGSSLGEPSALVVEAKSGISYFIRMDMETGRLFGHWVLSAVPQGEGDAEYRIRYPFEEDQKIAKEVVSD